jgi:uncharacterized LabA/DUF88 family protein
MSAPSEDNQRVMIFIDNSNIFRGFKKYKIKADYEKLKAIITNERILEGIFLYEGIVYPLSNQKRKWYKDLNNISGIEVKTSFDKKISHRPYEKKVDVKIAIDMVSYAYEDAYDIGILVSGDGDFLPVIKKVKSLKKQVEIWAFKYSLAYILKEEVGDENIHYLDDVLEEIEIKN